MQPNHIADECDELKRRTLALFSAIMGLEVLNETMRGAVADLAWDLSASLGKLSDKVCPNGGAKIKAVAS